MDRILRGPPLKMPKEARKSTWRYIEGKLRRHGTNIAQVDATNNTFATFHIIRERALRVSCWLEDAGLQRGEVLALRGTNSLTLAPLLLGAWSMGITCALLNPRSTKRETEHACDIAHPSAIISWGVLLEVTLRGEQRTDLVMELARILNDPLQPVRRNTPRFEAGRGSDLALILSSSGSTGLPKGVALSHYNLSAALSSSGMYASKAQTSLCVLPMFHAYALVLMLMNLCKGSTFVIMPRFSIRPFLSVANLHKVSTLYLVPSLLALLYRHLQQEGRGEKSCGSGGTLRYVQTIWTGAAAVHPEMQAFVKTALPGRPRLCHSYGLTETTFTVLAGPVRLDKPGSPGTLMPGFECKVVHSESPYPAPSLGPGAIGELLVRGPSLMQGYLNNTTDTSKAIDPDGWLRTGDLGHYDEDGYFFLLDRAKEMIKYHAHQVSPSELEAVLVTMPGVAEAVVVGIEDLVCGELPAALVVKEPGTVITETDIHRYFASVQLQATLWWSYLRPRTAQDTKRQNFTPKSPHPVPISRQHLTSVPPINPSYVVAPPPKTTAVLTTRVINNNAPRQVPSGDGDEQPPYQSSSTPLNSEQLDTATHGVTVPHISARILEEGVEVRAEGEIAAGQLIPLGVTGDNSELQSSVDSSSGASFVTTAFDVVFFCYSKYSIACILLMLLFIYGFVAFLKHQEAGGPFY